MKKNKVLSFGSAFSFPFNRAKGLFNIFWLFLPIFGWFAISGYVVRIVQGFCKGKFEKLPIMSFGSDMKLGFFMFLKAIPFVLAYIVVAMVLTLFGVAGALIDFLIQIFAIPILAINFINKQTVESFFEFRIVDAVFSNFKDYVVALLKEIGLAIVFVILSIVLVGIPAAMFTKNIFLADFYRRRC